MDTTEAFKTVIVLGACGLVGYVLYQALAEPGPDRLAYDDFGGGYEDFEPAYAAEFDPGDYEDTDELIEAIEEGPTGPRWHDRAREYGARGYGAARQYAPVVGREAWAATKGVGRGLYAGGKWAYGKGRDVDWERHARRVGRGAMSAGAWMDSLAYMDAPPPRSAPPAARMTVFGEPTPEALGWQKGQTMAMNRRRGRKSRRRRGEW
jgi:hypothetical protein